MRRAFDIAFKDLRIWMRDPSAMGILLGMPAILILILGSALGGLTSGGNTRIAVAIVNLDTRAAAIARTGEAAKLEDAILDSKRIRSLFQIAATALQGRLQQSLDLAHKIKKHGSTNWKQ